MAASATLAPPNASAIGSLRDQLLSIAGRLEEAESELRSAQVYQQHGEAAAAEAEREQAIVDYREASLALADLCLLLLRHARTHQSDTIRLYLVDLLRSEFNPLADSVVGCERTVNALGERLAAIERRLA